MPSKLRPIILPSVSNLTLNFMPEKQYSTTPLNDLSFLFKIICSKSFACLGFYIKSANTWLGACFDVLWRHSFPAAALLSAASKSSRYFEASSPLRLTFVLSSPRSNWHTAKFRFFYWSVTAPNDIVFSPPVLFCTVLSYSISTRTLLPIASLRRDSLLSQLYGSP